MDGAIWALAQATHELALFAAVGLLVGGVDDLLIDWIWMVRTIWRRAAIYTRYDRADAASLAAEAKGAVAVFVPAWREEAVIAAMAATALQRWHGQDVRLYVGCYSNDPATIAAVRELGEDERLRLVINDRAGPTTKADNLNAMWRAMLADEAAEGRRFTAVALHDAEDVVHSAEITVYAALCRRFDLVQLPVLALIERDSGIWRRFVSAHYADEFAESHGKGLTVREALGAGVPSAGVGCGLSRNLLQRIADRHGEPFDGGTVTEDYELGLRVREMGGRGVFVRIAANKDGGLVAVRAHFPNSIAAAVRQKARWQAGIALSGWRRLGWSGGWAEHWMRLRDRRAILAALVLLCAYVSAASLLLLSALGQAPRFTETELILFSICTGLMIWRLAMRALFVGRIYGGTEALASLPRVLLGNLIAMASARRALISYLRLARGAPLRWDKTEHQFPRTMPAE